MDWRLPFLDIKSNKKLLVLLFLLIVLPLTVLLVRQRVLYQKKAVETSQPEHSQPEYVPGEVLVKFKLPSEKLKIQEKIEISLEKIEAETPEAQALVNFLRENKIEKMEKIFKGAQPPKPEEKFDFSRNFKLKFDPAINVEEQVKKFSESGLVEYAEPNYLLFAELIPNDPEFNQLWGLHNTGQTGGQEDADIDAPEAWDITTDSEGITVGVIDTGIDYTHPDLFGNIWVNQAELNGSSGVDDDGNGYIDDVRGWDFANNDKDPMDDNGHGTHVAGTIGAIGNNNQGVVGVAWRTKILPLKFLGSDGSGTSDAAAAAVRYATDMGVKITNNSWGSYGGITSTLLDSIEYANEHGVLFVAAAGNSALNTDQSPHYPSGYEVPNVISVAASDHNDNLAVFSSGGSNYGIKTVDLAASGKSIFSTLPNNDYESYSGTSMATPHVVGAAALLWSQYPSWSISKLKSILLGSTDGIPSLNDKTVTGGRLNLYNALTAAGLLYTPREISVFLNKDETFSRTITLFNSGQQSLSWRADFETTSWLSLNKNSGTIMSESEELIDLSIDAIGLTPGVHGAQLNFTTSSDSLPAFSLPVFLTIRPEYEYLWGDNLGGPSTDTPIGMVKDGQDNIYILGDFRRELYFGSQQLPVANYESEVFLAKFDPSGKILWLKQLGNNVDRQMGGDIAMSPLGNIYITGKFEYSLTIGDQTITSDEGFHIFIAKFDQEGNLLWLRQIENQDYDYSSPVIGIDTNENYYLGAKVNNEDLLLKFDANGNELWRRLEKINDLVIDLNNNIYATGALPLIKYDPAGNKIFQKEGDSRFGEGKALTISNSNKVNITGYYNTFVHPEISSQNRDIWLAQYDANGNQIWQKIINGPIGEEFGQAITTDSEGNIYAGGKFSGDIYIDGYKFTSGTQSMFDGYLAIFTEDSRFLYFRSFGNDNFEEEISSVLVDQTKDAYLLGAINQYLIVDDKRIYSKGDKDLFVLKLVREMPLPEVPLPDSPGKAIYLENGDYIEITDRNLDLVFSPEFTFEAWIKPEINPHNYTSQSIIKRSRLSADDYDFQLFHTPDDLSDYKYSWLTLHIGTNGCRFKKQLPINKWVHIGLTRSNNQASLFLNGKFFQTVDLPTGDAIPANPADFLSFGSEVGVGYTNLQLQGTLDDIRISNIVRDVGAIWKSGAYFQPLEIDEHTLGLWKFEENLEDSSQNDKDGVDHGGLHYVDGIVASPDLPPIWPVPTPPEYPSQAAYFDENSYVEIPAPNSLEGKNDEDFTVEAWIKPELKDKYESLAYLISRRIPDLAGRFYGLMLGTPPDENPSDLRFSFGDATTDGGWTKTEYIIPLNQWNHVAGVKEGNELKLFINGKLTAWKPFINIKDNSGGMDYIGAWVFSSSLYTFKGLIDDLRISNVARDVGKDWREGKYFQSLVADEYTLGLWNFENNLIDNSGHENNSVLYGNISYASSIVAAPDLPPTPTLTPTPTPSACPAQAVPQPCSGGTLCQVANCWSKTSDDVEWATCSQYDYDGDCNIDVVDIMRCSFRCQMNGDAGSCCVSTSVCDSGLSCQRCYRLLGECQPGGSLNLQNILNRFNQGGEELPDDVNADGVINGLDFGMLLGY